jgi:hypothetical protein
MMKRVLVLQLLAAALVLALAWGGLMPVAAAAEVDEVESGEVMEALKEAVEVGGGTDDSLHI